MDKHEVVIPADAQRRAGTQGKICARNFWGPGLARGFGRDDNRGAL